MVRYQVLCPLYHPGQVADAELAALCQSGAYGEARRIGERPGPSSSALSRGGRKPARAQRLGPVQVEAKDVAALVRHRLILTPVEMCLPVPAPASVAANAGTFRESTEASLGLQKAGVSASAALLLQGTRSDSARTASSTSAWKH